ncbi:hypothetical protein B0H14DRAFT_2573681 [Mycena olivaceomarginata]|nr:hypothetical protein B0H14DRAFT_2573681 [Mycena olivaceomarginata]
MGEKRRREVMDYVLVPKSELDGEIQASNRGEWGGVMQNGFEYANHRRKAGNIPRSPRPPPIKSTQPEAAAVHTSLEDALNDAWSRNERAGTIPGVGRKVNRVSRERGERELTQGKSAREPATPPTATSSGHPASAAFPFRPPAPCIMKRYEPGTVPFVIQAPADECLKCQGRCTCDKCTKIRDDIYQPPEHRGRSSSQTRCPAYSDLEQVVIEEPMVYYATMYDCHTSAPVAETFVGADGGVVVQARPLQKKQRVSVGEERPSPTVLSMPTQAARVAELDVDKVDAAPNSDAIFNLGVSTEAAMPQTQPSYAHSDSSNGSRVNHALHRHAPAGPGMGRFFQLAHFQIHRELTAQIPYIAAAIRMASEISVYDGRRNSHLPPGTARSLRMAQDRIR